MVNCALVQFGREMIGEDLDHPPSGPMCGTFDADRFNVRSRNEVTRDSRRTSAAKGCTAAGRRGTTRSPASAIITTTPTATIKAASSTVTAATSGTTIATATTTTTTTPIKITWSTFR